MCHLIIFKCSVEVSNYEYIEYVISFSNSKHICISVYPPHTRSSATFVKHRSFPYSYILPWIVKVRSFSDTTVDIKNENKSAWPFSWCMIIYLLNSDLVNDKALWTEVKIQHIARSKWDKKWNIASLFTLWQYWSLTKLLG